MPGGKRHFNTLTTLAATLLLMAACATPPPPAPAEPAEVLAAEQAERGREWSRAARLWLDAATEAQPSDANLYRMNAAAAWINAGESDRGSDLLRQVDENGLQGRDRGRYSLILAELALESGDVERAGFYLQAAQPYLDNRLQRDYRQLERELANLKADPYIQAITRANQQLTEMRVYDPARALAILQTLESVPSGRLEQLSEGNDRINQWGAAALTIRRTLVSNSDLLEASQQWAINHPRHEIGSERFMELTWQYGQSFQPPSRIAVLLPEDGNLAGAGAAIRDGLVSAWLERPAASELNFIPVGASPESALQAYRDAEAAGYQWVIGPLRRESTQRVVDQGNGRPPGLLLNEFDAPPGAPRDLHGLSLSQPLEAASLAQLMLDSGMRRAVMLVAESSWGYRVETAFAEAFRAGGGEVVAAEYFNAAQADHSDRLASMLKIEDSRQRKDSLQAALRLPLAFEPTRRDDFEVIFMAADPTLGRQLKPQLKFYDAGDKPVYAMSRIFSGRVNTTADTDLNGVVFATTQWALTPSAELPGFASTRGGAFGSLFSLGTDAWRVIPWLELMRKDPELSYQGAVGQLRIGDGGQLVREPVWARFSRGRPVAWEPAPQP